jgi:hypothetical protein
MAIATSLAQAQYVVVELCDAPTDINNHAHGGAVVLAWRPAAGECAAASYLVQAGSAAGSSDVALLNVGNATALSVSAPPGAYVVRVVAVKAFGASAPSEELTISVGPMAVDLTGISFGSSDYLNAPFTMNITHCGDAFGGTYRDQKDFGGVAGQAVSFAQPSTSRKELIEAVDSVAVRSVHQRKARLTAAARGVTSGVIRTSRWG